MEIMADAWSLHNYGVRRIADGLDGRVVLRFYYRSEIYRTASHRARVSIRGLHRFPFCAGKGTRLLAVADARPAYDHPFADGRRRRYPPFAAIRYIGKPAFLHSLFLGSVRA